MEDQWDFDGCYAARGGEEEVRFSIVSVGGGEEWWVVVLVVFWVDHLQHFEKLLIVSLLTRVCAIIYGC